MTKATIITNPFPASFDGPTNPNEQNYYVQDVSEYDGKPCVLVFSQGFYYLLTSIEVLADDEISYDLAVGRPLDAKSTGEDVDALIEWLDDKNVDIETHGMRADEIVQSVLQDAV